MILMRTLFLVFTLSSLSLFSQNRNYDITWTSPKNLDLSETEFVAPYFEGAVYNDFSNLIPEYCGRYQVFSNLPKNYSLSNVITSQLTNEEIKLINVNKLKSDFELKRAYWLFRLVQSRSFVMMGKALTNLAIKFRLPVEGLI